MNKKVVAVIAIFAAGVILFGSTYVFDLENRTNPHKFSWPFPAISLPDLKILPSNDAVVATDAWSVFQKYLVFARAHDLTGVKSLSHQVSATCQDPTKKIECEGLMDSIVIIGTEQKEADFKHIYSDDKQVIMHTDGPDIGILYFTKSVEGETKVLGLKFCSEEKDMPGSCDDNLDRDDDDKDGWWNSIESLFY